MRWKALPGTLEPAWHQLVVRLRQLKDDNGFSLALLQAKTHFSASSWDRYLNGKVLPPPAAVERLAGLAGADAESLLILWNAAADARAAPPAPLADDSPPAPRRAPEPELRVAALSAAAGALLLSATASVCLLVLAPRAPTAAANVSQAGRYTCDYTRHDDQLFAGNSTTTSHVVMRNNTGPDAAEVQCLLLRHKLSPGDIDGYYGEQTEAQIAHLQRQDHVPADGIVGEQTWTLLRHVR
ncbi:peptidoglycan-binding protein [Streptomyces sp. NPDC088736]|uniref:peptidoglycan-binding protein n=1 Tax=Streptomyces sp. NPDC088736 TaxID=3365881 RepID=UPI0038124955